MASFEMRFPVDKQRPSHGRSNWSRECPGPQSVGGGPRHLALPFILSQGRNYTPRRTRDPSNNGIFGLIFMPISQP